MPLYVLNETSELKPSYRLTNQQQALTLLFEIINMQLQAKKASG